MSIDTSDTTDDKKNHKLEDAIDESALKKKKRKHRKDADDTAESKESKKKHKKKRKDNSGDKSPSESPAVTEEKHKKKRKRESKEKVTDGDIRQEGEESIVNESQGGKSDEKKKKRKKEEKVKSAANSTKEANRSEGQHKVDDSPSKPLAFPLPSNSNDDGDGDTPKYLSKHGVTIDYGSSTDSNNLMPILSFLSLLPRIPELLHSAIGSFKEPTPIQACSWPASLDGRDVIGIAETGSGKTLAFGIPAVSHIVKTGTTTTASSKKSKSKHTNNNNGKQLISVLAIAPTRELALQTHETFTELGKPFGLSSVALYGGVDKAPQKRELGKKGAAMIVGTPGRILDLVNDGSCDLSGVTYLVLDEADRMLDKGFENDIRAIIGQCVPPGQRQTLMFSATWPDAVRRLASTFLRDPVRVTVGSDDLTANRRVEQVVEVFDDPREKDTRLLSHLRKLNAKKPNSSSSETRILIFVLYKKEAARVEETLRRKGFSVGGIHGDLSQPARMAALEDFKTGRTQLLVATDVAARGLDIPSVGSVINYSFPLTVEDYVHRIGRTGRGGRTGKSITFFTGDGHERALAGELAKVMREGGFDFSALKDKFPMTIKKREHSVYGAFYRDDIPTDVKPTRMKFN